MKTFTHYRSLLLLFLTGILTTSCTKDPQENPVREQLIRTNLEYGSDSRQRMDIYLPEGRDEATPIVILIHGGAWTSGNKEDMTTIQQTLLDNRIGSVNINYRYASASNHVEGLMADVGMAINAVSQQATGWGIRKTDYQLLGASAGAHMALLYAYHYQQAGQISAVISVAGPTVFAPDFLAFTAITDLKAPIEAMTGAPVELPYTNPLFAAASPITYADTAVPTMLIHGTADLVVPHQMSVDLQATLKAKGKTVQFESLAGVGHDFLGNPIAALQAIAKALEWITNQG